MGGERHRSHSHHHRRHHHHKHKSSKHDQEQPVQMENNLPISHNLNLPSEEDSVERAKKVIVDFRKENEEALDDLKTQFHLLDNGYSVDLGKVSNSLLQGTLNVVFTLLHLPSTNRGFFWDEEEYNGSRISDLFSDVLSPTLEYHPHTDSNVIDLDDLDGSDEVDMGNPHETNLGNSNESGLGNPHESTLGNPHETNLRNSNESTLKNPHETDSEETFGPPLPSTIFTKSTNEQGHPMVGPVIPDEIASMIAEGIPVQIEAEEEVGPRLPGEETRTPTAEALEQVAHIREGERVKEHAKLERAEWMTMMPEASSLSSIFAAPKSRRFASMPAGCKMDPSWAETPEQREKRIREHLSKTLIGGYQEPQKLTREQEKEKEKEMEAYFEQYEREYRSESLAEVHQRISKQKKENKDSDPYSRESIFKRPAKRDRHDVDFVQNRGSLKSRFGTVTYKMGSL